METPHGAVAHGGPLLEAHLPPPALGLVRDMGRVLVGRGVAAYLVGGVPRDALLGRRFQGDLDVTLVGDGIAAAGWLAEALHGEVQTRSLFGTAMLSVAGIKIDVVTARRETYPAPGALPTVQPAPLPDDLARRDFSINAVAIAIGPEAWGQVHDPQAGLADIDARRIRVLHQASFVDDPTRMVRAVRYAVRLGFDLEDGTAALLLRSAPALAALSPARRWHELERCLREPRADLQIAALDAWGLLRHVHPGLALPAGWGQRVARWRRSRYDDSLTPEGWLALLCWDCPATTLEGIAADLVLPAAFRDSLLAVVALRAGAIEGLSPQAAFARFQPLPRSAVQAAAYALDSAAGRATARTYLALWRYVRPALRGDDLLKLGVPQGPAVGRFLAALRAARHRDVVRSADEERWLIADWLATGGPPAE